MFQRLDPVKNFFVITVKLETFYMRFEVLKLKISKQERSFVHGRKIVEMFNLFKIGLV